MVRWDALDYANLLASPASEPTYRRIVALLRRLISEGRLKAGDALPTERDLARMAGLARGTVSLAYAELRREGIVTSAPGRGSRVASDQNVSTESRKEQAIRILSNALERLEALGLTPREVEAFLHLVQLGREGHGVQLRAALVDCNPEALALMGRQMAGLGQLALEPMLLEDLARLGSAELGGFDLVITTDSHTPQVMGHLARQGFPLERLLSVALSPSRETLVALARLPQSTRVAIRTESARFAEIVQKHVASLGHPGYRLAPGEAPQPGDRLLVPAGTEAPDALPFDYQIDRGSLLRIDETVTALLLRKGEGCLGSR